MMDMRPLYLIAGFSMATGGFGISARTIQWISLGTLSGTVFTVFSLISALMSGRRAKAAGGFMPIMGSVAQPVWRESAEWADPVYLDGPVGAAPPFADRSSEGTDSPAPRTTLRSPPPVLPKDVDHPAH